MGLTFDPIEEARRKWIEHGWGDGAAMVVATSITRAHQIVLAEINAALAPFGLTFSRFEVVALLYFSANGELPMGKIGTRLQVHPTSVTSLVNRLVADGLVERVAHPTDRRTTLVRLRPEGRELAPECAAALESADFGVSGLEPQEAHDLSALLASMRQATGDWIADS